MSDRNKSDKPQDRKDSNEGNKPKGGGGFGAFSDVYRARWAANHPDMNRAWPADAMPDPSTPPDAAIDPTIETTGADPIETNGADPTIRER